MSSIILIAWLMIWAGYSSTDFQRVFVDGSFKIDTEFLLDFKNAFHWSRSIFPVLAGVVALFFIWNTSFLITPLGLLTIYGLIGCASELINGYKVMGYLWWAFLFMSAVLVLGAVASSANPLQNVSFIIQLNGFIAGIISLSMMGYLIARPEFFKNLSFRSLFHAGSRPFEAWGGGPANTKFLGMVGTRPTGMARYAAVASLVVFCNFLNGGLVYFLLFCLFTFIVLFSKGRTEIMSFLVSLTFIFFATNIILTPMIFILGFITMVSLLLVFGNIKPKIPSVVVQPATSLPSKLPNPDENLSKKQFSKKLITLSGRTNGPWKVAISFIKKHFFIGYGFGTAHHLVRGSDGLPAGVDSTILQSLMQAGILGTLFFLTALLSTGYMAIHIFISGGNSLLIESSAIGIFFLLRGLTQSFAGYSADWIFLAPIIAYFQIFYK